MYDRRRILAGIGTLAGLAPVLKVRAETTPPARPDIASYVRSPAIEDTSLSPDGRHVAAITKTRGTYYAAIRDRNSQKDIVFDLGEKKVRSLFWGSNHHIVVVTSLTIGDDDGRAGLYIGWGEHFLVHTYNIDTGAEYILFDHMSGFTTSIAGDVHRIRPDAAYKLTASGYNYLGQSLRAFDLDTGKSTEIDKSSDGVQNWAITPNGTLVARCTYDVTKKIWSLQFHINKRWKTVYTQTESIDYPSLVGLGRSDQTVIIGIWAGEAAGNYFEIGPDGILSSPLNTVDNNLAPLFHPTTKRFCGFARIDDDITYAYEDPQIQKVSELCKAALSGQRVTICEYAAEDPRQVLIRAESADDPGTYYVIDFGAGTSMPVGTLYPGLPLAWIAERKPITYKAADGLDIHGYLTLPPSGFSAPAGKPLPLIVLPHGGPQARDTLSFDWESQLYASRGYAVLQPNFRGSTGYGKAFVEAGYGEWGRKMQTDLSDGVRYLAKAGLIDPERVAIVGASYGGYAALAGATLDTGIYRCAVAIAGVSHLKDMVSTNKDARYNSTTSLYWKRFMGEPNTLDEISPYKQAAKCTIPVLMIHGTDDTVVSIEQSRKMRDALKKAGKDVTLIEQKDEDHWETNEARRLEMSQAVIDFFEKHNPPQI